MKSKIGMILAVVLIAGLTVPAFAAVESVKVGGDITIYGVYRHNLDFVKNSGSRKDSSNFFQTSTRIYVTADLTDMVSAMVRLINERDWGYETDISCTEVNRDDPLKILLDLAYIKVADIMTPGLTLTVGRQEIQIGEGLVVGSRYNIFNYIEGNTRIAAKDLGLQKAFDAIRVDYEMSAAPVNICVFMAKIDETITADTGLDKDTNLFGLSLLYNADNFTVEPYYVMKNVLHLDENLSTAGVRATGSIPVFGGIALKGEFAKQFGEDSAGKDYKGWAGYVGADYAFDTNMNPTMSIGYSYFSGATSTDTDIKHWKPVYPSNIADRVGKIAYAALFSGGAGPEPDISGTTGSGLQVINLGFGLQPVEKLTLSLDWYNLKLNKVATAGKKKALGNEIDLGVNYAYTEDLTFGLDIGYLMKGKAIKNAIKGTTPPGEPASAWQAIVSMAVAF